MADMRDDASNDVETAARLERDRDCGMPDAIHAKYTARTYPAGTGVQVGYQHGQTWIRNYDGSGSWMAYDGAKLAGYEAIS